MTKKTNKALAVLMALIMVISLLPVSALASYDTGSLSVKTKGADAVTSVPDLDPGEVWTDKSVSYTSAADDLFQIQLSALGQNFSGLTPGSTTLANVVLVLDISGSTQDDNKLDNMVSAVNTAVSSILAANPANQVGVVTFSTGSDTLVTLRSTSFDLTTDWDDQDSDTFYVYGNGGTNIQSGINRGYDLLEAANDTATPIMIVLSDGVACYYNASYASIPTGSYGNSGWQQDGNGYLNVSDGVSTNQGITAAAYTIVQAMYLKDQMPELQIYTIGYGTGANKLANATLNPTPGNIALVTGAGSSPITLTSQLTATGYSAPAGYFYPEVGGTFSGTSVDIPTLIATFNSIINASLNNFSPLASGQPVTFTEAIGAGFEVSGSLAMVLKSGTYTFTDADGDGTYTCTTTAPAGVSVTVSGTTAKTLTWVIPESELPCNYYTLDDEDNPVSHVVTPASLTFNVALKSGAVADTMYFTNYDSAAAYAAGATSPGAHATFKPSATNPSYYDAVPGTTPTYPDNSDWEVEVRRTGTQGNRTYTVTGLENDGTSYTGIIAGYNVVRGGSQEYRTYDITVNLSDGTVLFFNDVHFDSNFDGNDSTRSQDDLTADIDYTNTTGTGTTYEPKSNVGMDGNGVVTMLLPKSGWIELRCATASLRINKVVAAYDGSNKGPVTEFAFQVSVAGFTGTAKIYNASGTQQGTAAITSGSGSITLRDGWYAIIGGIPVGTHYSVTEDSAGNGYVTTTTGDPSNSIASSGNYVTFTNTFYPTAQISITKEISKLYTGVAVPTGRTFPFSLYSYDATTGEYPLLSAFTASVTTDSSGAPYSTTMDVRMDKIAGLFGTGSSAVTLYVHEGSMTGGVATGWTQDGGYYPVTISKSGQVTYQSGSTVTFTNTYIPTSQLKVEKSITGGDVNKQFEFSVVLGGTGDYTCSLYKNSTLVQDVDGDGDVDSDDTLYDNSTLSVALKSNDYIVITGLPVGTPYTVTENSYVTEGYISSLASNTTTGSVLSDGSTVSVTNTYQTNDLTVSKSVTGPAPATDTFTFTVEMNGDLFPGTFSYVYSDDEPGAPLHTSSDGTFTLKDGQSATLKGIPAGATYTVTETADSAYTTSSGTVLGSLTPDDYDVNVLLPITGATTVYFENAYKTGQLTVSKSVLVDGGSPESSNTYPITVTFTGDYLSKITCSIVGVSGVAGTGTLTFYLDLADDDSATFSDIPAGVTYTVEETDAKGADDVNYEFSDTGKTISYNALTHLGDADSVTITNSYLTPATLTISKSVTGSGDDSPTPGTFEFEIYFYKMVEQEPYIPEGGTEMVYPPDVEEAYNLAGDELPSGLTRTADGTYTFTLADTGKLVFENLPVDLYFEVQETSNGGARDSYATVNTAGAGYAEVDGTNDLLVTGQIPQDASGETPITISYTNDFTMTHGLLTITKYVTDQTFTVDGTYTFSVVFTGQTDMTLDTLPAGVAAEDGDPVIDGDTVTYTFTANVSAGSNISITFSGLRVGTGYTVTETDAGGADTTKVNGDGGTSASGTMARQENNAFAVQNVTLTFENIYDPPTTTTTKTVDNRTVYVGSTVEYTVTVTNTGEDPVDLDAVEDLMLASADAGSVMLNGSTDGFTLDTTAGDGTDTPRMVIGTELAAGASVTITYSVTFDTPGTKLNTATSVAHRGEYTVKSSDTVTVTVIPNSDISVSKLVADGTPEENGGFGERVPADYLDTLTYDVVITNSGAATLTGIELSDSYFGQTTTTIVSATLNGTTTLYPKVTGSAMTFYTDDTLTTPLGSFAPDDTIEVIYTAPATAFATDEYPDAATNTATASGYDGLGKPTDSDSASYTIVPPTISVTKSASDTSIYTNESVTYTVEITNGYDLPMELISINDTMFADADADGLPDSGAYNIVAKDQDGNPLSYTPVFATSTLSFNTGTTEAPIYPSVAPGEKVTITYTVYFAEAGSYNNTATATMSYRGLTADADDTETVRVADPSIGVVVTKLVNGKPSVTVSSGTTVTYTASIENTSDVDLCHVYFADAAFKDPSFQVVSVVKALGESTTPLTNYTFETLEDGTRVLTFGYQDVFEKGATITVTYTLRLTASYINEVTGFAFFNSEERWTNNQDTASVTIRRDDPPSDPIYYTVTVNYLDQDTGESIKDPPYTTSGRKGTDYDVTDQILETITTTAGDYELVGQTGAAEGTLNSDKVINLYYTLPEVDIPDNPDVPGGDQPGDVIEDDDTPLGNLPQTGTVAEPAKHVWPLGMLAISLSMAAAGLHITFSRKRKEDEE